MLDMLQRAALPAPLHAQTVYRAATAIRGESGVYRYLEEMRKIERWSCDELTRWRDDRLAMLLSFAARNVPFWQERGLHTAVAASEALERLRDLPFTEKADLQRRREDMKARRHPGRLAVKSTGGSTAEPVMLYKSSDAIAREMAASWMAHGWFGIRIGDRAVRFWGNPLTQKRRARSRLADLAMNRLRINAFALKDDDLHAYWRTLQRFKPRWLYGYASLLDLYAQFIEREGLDGTSLGIRLVVPTSEPLTDDAKARIGRVFGSAVQNEYGCGEFGPIAYSCEHGTLHTMAQNLHVELLTEDGREASVGETGEIVVTDLFNFGAPLIRYRMGDRATRGTPCACGRPFPTLGRVWGRIWDVVHTPDGERIHGEKVDYLFSQIYREMPTAFRQYQVVQTGPSTVTVNLVSDAEIPAEALLRIKGYFRDECGGMMATVRRVDAIPRARSGKLRTLVNEWSPHSNSPE